MGSGPSHSVGMSRTSLDVAARNLKGDVSKVLGMVQPHVEEVFLLVLVSKHCSYARRHVLPQLSTDIKLVVWIGGLELVARPFFVVFDFKFT